MTVRMPFKVIDNRKNRPFRIFGRAYEIDNLWVIE